MAGKRSSRLPRRYLARKGRTAVAVLLLLSAFTAFLIPAARYFRMLTGTMAESSASDILSREVSAVVERKMLEWGQENREYIHFEKDSVGAVTAIVTDTAQVNILCSELLHALIDASSGDDLTVRIPLGNLLGVSMLLGKGPRIPMKLTMLTSSQVSFQNVLSDAGINQTKHQLLLEVEVNASVLLPWEIRSARVKSEVLVAETIVIGHVPDTYVHIKE